ncbi:MAG: hypothetical protein SynsKO_13580 [Synoicihabitans sp.]
MKTVTLRLIFALGLALAGSFRLSGQSLAELVESAGMRELAATFSPEKTDRILGDDIAIPDHADRAAAAVMVAMGVWTRDQLDDTQVCRDALEQWTAGAEEVTTVLAWDLSNVAEIFSVSRFGGHEALREDAELMATLDEAIGAEVLTGYGLRSRGVSHDTDARRTVIYSHSSLPHVKQLIGLVASEGLRGRVMIAPKIAAFVFREGWGERPEWINELGPGIYVAQGPEMLVHFEFEQASDRQRFDLLVERYAKKDEEHETGNIIRSWWQPFYYGETPIAGYREISRVTVYSEQVEASLLMLPARAELVRSHFSAGKWSIEADSIWVSRPFFRFLEGDFK